MNTASPPESSSRLSTTVIAAPDDWSDDCDCLHPDAVQQAKHALGDASSVAEVARMFAVLSDPTRMRVLIALGGSELCVTDLAAATGANRTTISHQLRVLRGHRLVRRRRDGKVVYYALDDDHVIALLNMASAHTAEDSTSAGSERASA